MKIHKYIQKVFMHLVTGIGPGKGTDGELHMRIFAIADIHGNEDVLDRLASAIKEEEPDLIVCSGDIVKGMARRAEWHAAQQENRDPDWSRDIKNEVESELGFYDRFFGMLNELGMPVLCVPGKRDAPKELFGEVAVHAEESYENIRIIHNSEFRFNGFVFRGFGGELTEELREDQFIHQYKRLDLKSHILSEGENLILVTHSPPVGARVSKENGSEKGSPVVNDILERSKAFLMFCSYAHEPNVEHISGAYVVNPGPLENRYYAIVDVDKSDKVEVRHQRLG